MGEGSRPCPRPRARDTAAAMRKEGRWVADSAAAKCRVSSPAPLPQREKGEGGGSRPPQWP